jgi:hypothetical protein
MAEDRITDEQAIKRLLKKAEEEPINFAFGLGTDPAKHVLAMHLLKNPKKMFETVKADGKLKAGTWGTARVEDKILILNIVKKCPGLAKNVKLFLKDKPWKQKKPRILFEGQDITEEEEGAMAGEGAQAGGPATLPVEKAKTFTQAAAAWSKTRDLVQQELKKLQTSILTKFKDVPDVKKLAGSVKQLDGILDKLDDRLTRTLTQAAGAPDAGQATEKQREANAIIKEYAAYVSRDPLLKSIDQNPFVKLNVHRTLSSALKAIAEKMAS